MFLILSILCSSLIFVIFKVFNAHKVNTLQAIVVNYYTACIIGFYNYDAPISVIKIIDSDWFIGALVLGILFISIFNVMALTTQKNGLSVASVASKMSFAIPIIFGLYTYNETLNIQKGIGIILALVSVYLACLKAKQTAHISLKNFTLPLLLFLGSGVIDTSIKYIEDRYLYDNGIPVFSATVFLCAGLIGLTLLGVKAIKHGFNFSYKSIIGGMVLGFINYYSIYMLLKALHMPSLESSVVFTINNVAIVMLSTLLGLVFFKERLSQKNCLGIGLAIISIVLVTFA